MQQNNEEPKKQSADVPKESRDTRVLVASTGGLGGLEGKGRTPVIIILREREESMTDPTQIAQKVKEALGPARNVLSAMPLQLREKDGALSGAVRTEIEAGGELPEEVTKKVIVAGADTFMHAGSWWPVPAGSRVDEFVRQLERVRAGYEAHEPKV